MDQFRRRAEDIGQESAKEILARIDERTRVLIKNLDEHLIKYDKYVTSNDSDIRGLYKTQYIGYGVLIAFNFLVLLFKH